MKLKRAIATSLAAATPFVGSCSEKPTAPKADSPAASRSADSAGASGGCGQRSSDDVLAEVRRLVARQMGVAEFAVTPRSNLVEDFNADSLDSVELVMTFEDTFKIAIPDAKCAAAKTVEDCAAMICEIVNAQPG